MNRAEKLDLYTRRILGSEGIPPFARHAEELLTVSLDANRASSHLARVILKDLGLTSHILRVANSPLYNRSGKSIGSIAHAITMLGWDTIRHLVGAMRFVEHYARKSPGLRELMLLSLISAAQARHVSSLIGYARPEEAYVCGLFRRLGEVVMARYYPNEYAAIIDLMEREHISERAAAIRVCDLVPEDIASNLAAAWNLPDPVRACLSAGPPSPGDRCLTSIVNYTHELSAALYRRGAPFESVHLKTVTDPFGKQVFISQRDLCRIVDTAIDDAQHTLDTLRVGIPALHLARQAEQARELLEASLQGTLPLCDLLCIDAGIRELAVPFSDLSSVVSQALDLLTTSGGFERAVFALTSDNGRRVRGRMASGDPSILDRFHFPIGHGDPALDVVMLRGQDLWIKRRVDARYESSRLLATLDPSHFALFGITLDGAAAGVLYADRRTLHTPDEMRPRVDQIRNRLASALRSQPRPQNQTSPAVTL